MNLNTAYLKDLLPDLNAHIAEVLPQNVEKQVAKAEKQAERSGSALNLDNLANVKTEVSASDIQFCALCLSVRKTVNDLISRFGWLTPGPSAKVKTFMSMFFAKFYPFLCGQPPAE